MSEKFVQLNKFTEELKLQIKQQQKLVHGRSSAIQQEVSDSDLVYSNTALNIFIELPANYYDFLFFFDWPMTIPLFLPFLFYASNMCSVNS